MKHGDRINTRVSWARKGLGMKSLIYRFRYDPVPFTGINYFGKAWFFAWNKRPRTTQEKRMSYAHKEYIRPRRNAFHLPDVYDERLRSDCKTRKSWKKRCKIRKQWMKNESLSM